RRRVTASSSAGRTRRAWSTGRIAGRPSRNSTAPRRGNPDSPEPAWTTGSAVTRSIQAADRRLRDARGPLDTRGPDGPGWRAPTSRMTSPRFGGRVGAERRIGPRRPYRYERNIPATGGERHGQFIEIEKRGWPGADRHAVAWTYPKQFCASGHSRPSDH